MTKKIGMKGDSIVVAVTLICPNDHKTENIQHFSIEFCSKIIEFFDNSPCGKKLYISGTDSVIDTIFSKLN